MISDSYTAMKYILQTNTTITDLLGVYIGTAIPLIAGEVLEEVETDLPAIVYTVDFNERTQILDDQYFIVNCYAATKRESFILAKTIVDEFNECDNNANGYYARTTCKIQGNVGSPDNSEYNTPVEFRIVNI